MFVQGPVAEVNPVASAVGPVAETQITAGVSQKVS